MFLPQIPYMCPGLALDELICYPLCDDPKSLPSEATVSELLRQVGLNPLPLLSRQLEAQQSGAELDWSEVMSRGQKQRLALARVLFHRPKFAVFDEAISALDRRSERQIYERCVNMGITVITVALPGHSVQQFHCRVLTLRGSGKWDLAPIEANATAELLRTQSLSIKADEAKAAVEKEAADSLQASIDSRSKAYVAAVADDRREQNDKSESATLRSDLKRLGTIINILIPKLSLGDTGIRLLIAQFAMLTVSVTVGTGILGPLFSQFQGLAMQGDAAGYLRLTILRTVLQVVMTGMGIFLTNINQLVSMHWAKQLDFHVSERYMANGRFFALSQIDRRIMDADTRITRELIEVCDQLSRKHTPHSPPQVDFTGRL